MDFNRGTTAIIQGLLPKSISINSLLSDWLSDDFKESNPVILLFFDIYWKDYSGQ
jgi:hypothetical protein